MLSVIVKNRTYKLHSAVVVIVATALSVSFSLLGTFVYSNYIAAAFDADVYRFAVALTVFDATIVGFVVTVITLKIISKLNDKIKQEIENTKEANNQRRQLLAIVSHEIRGPVQTIAMYSELFEEHFNSNPTLVGVEDAKALKRVSEHIVSVLNDMLLLSSIESTSNKNILSSVRVVEVIDAAIFFVRKDAERKGVVIINDIDSNELIVKTDEGKLKQVLINLIQNAVKHSECTKIIVSAIAKPKKIEIKVTDNGIGFGKNLLENMYAPYTTSSRSVSNGVGLGMAIVKSLVNLLNGTINIETSKNKGTIITIELPDLDTGGE